MKKHPALAVPLAIFMAAIPLSAKEPAKFSPKAVSWTTPDGVRLHGLYNARSGPGRLVWVLLHGLGSNKQEWLGFAEKLAQQGTGFLIYDARGHGDSLSMSNGGKISYRSFSEGGAGSQWDRMAGDLESAVQFLKAKYPLNAHGIAVGGASLGANVALIYASRHPDVPAILLLSPGLQYAGIASEEAFLRYTGRPAFVAASPGDDYSYASVKQLSKSCGGADCVIDDGEGSAHGVNMLDEKMTKKILQWIRSQESVPPARKAAGTPK